jgi:hypothetical protein
VRSGSSSLPHESSQRDYRPLQRFFGIGDFRTRRSAVLPLRLMGCCSTGLLLCLWGTGLGKMRAPFRADLIP